VPLLHKSVDQKMTVLEEGTTDIQAELLRQRQSCYSHGPCLDIRDEIVCGLLESFDEVSLKTQGIEYKISESSSWANGPFLTLSSKIKERST
jgi:hypothetical protein